MQPQFNKSWPEKIGDALRGDPKRTALMSGLAVVMIVLWGRLLLSGPASATASLIRRSVVAITESPQQTSAAPSSNPTLDWLAQPKAAVDRNLFAIHLDYYAKATGRTGSKAGSDDSGSSTFNSNGQANQILLENLQTQAARLKLQSTLLGNTPTALVNGQLVKAGDCIDGFTVVQIESRKIVVQQDGVTLDIAMP